MSTEDHLCTHPIGQCEIVDTVDVIPNSFNIVLDKKNALFSHVLQCSESNTIKNKIQNLIDNESWVVHGGEYQSYTVVDIEDLKALINNETS